MKSFDELSRLGRLRRMRRLAEAALDECGLGGAHLKLYMQAGNTLYRVYHSNQPIDILFEPGHTYCESTSPVGRQLRP